MNISLGKQTAIGCALLAGVAIIGAATWLFFPRYVVQPQDLLPSDRTIALLIRPQRSLLAAMERHAPALVPPGDLAAGDSYALVRMDDGSRAWVTLRIPEKGDTASVALSSGHPAAVPMISRESARLAADPDVRLLVSGKDNEIFIRPEALEETEAFFPFDTPSRAVVITASDGSLSWRFRRKDVIGTSSAYGLEPSDAAIAITASDLGASILTIGHALRDDASEALYATVATAVRRAFGEDISLQYDILPLLAGPGTLHVTRTGSGISFTLLTTIEEEEAAGNMAERLHRDVRTMLSAPRRVDLTFDDQFSMTSMVSDADIRSEDIQADGGWSAYGTQLNGRGFFTAHRDRTWVISNDEAMFRRQLGGNQPETSGSAAAGQLRPDAFMTLLHDTMPGVFSGLALPSGSGGLLRWNMRHSGTITSLTLE